MIIRMVRLLTVAVLILSSSTLYSSQAFSSDEGTRVGVVNIQAVIDQSKAGQSIQKQLEDNRTKFQGEIEKREKELKSLQEDFAKNKESFTQEQVAQKKVEFDKKVIEAKKLAQKRTMALEAATRKAMEELQGKLTGVVDDVAKKEKFDLVMTRQDVIVADKSLDITDKVLKQLNSKVGKIDLKVDTN